jgi:hypothetical protein
MVRDDTHVEDETVYGGTPDGPLEVGAVGDVLDVVGGPAWRIEYRDVASELSMDTSDEGRVVDVVDMMQAMTHSERFVETLSAQPADPTGVDEISPRLGLFVGKLLENLESGVA